MTGLTLWNKRFFDTLLQGLDFSSLEDVEYNLRGYQAVGYVPKADVVETEKEYRLSFDLPGYEESRLNIEVKKGTLHLSGSLEESTEPKEGEKYLLRERAKGSFKRAFNLPENADSSSIEAKLDKGILHITIAKKAEEQPRKINIQ